MNRNLFRLISYSITNIATTLILKLQGAVSVNQNNESRNFFHPFMQTEVMIIWEGLCLIAYYFTERNRAKEENKLPAKVSLCILPLCLDLASSVLVLVAFNYLTGSVYSILSGEAIVFTAIFTKLVLKKSISKAQIVGSIITIISAILAGIGQTLGDKQGQQIDLMILGIILVTIANAVQAIISIIYEYIYNKWSAIRESLAQLLGLSLFWLSILFPVLLQRISASLILRETRISKITRPFSVSQAIVHTFQCLMSLICL